MNPAENPCKEERNEQTVELLDEESAQRAIGREEQSGEHEVERHSKGCEPRWIDGTLPHEVLHDDENDADAFHQVYKFIAGFGWLCFHSVWVSGLMSVAAKGFLAKGVIEVSLRCRCFSSRPS